MSIGDQAQQYIQLEESDVDPILSGAVERDTDDLSEHCDNALEVIRVYLHKLDSESDNDRSRIVGLNLPFRGRTFSFDEGGYMEAIAPRVDSTFSRYSKQYPVDYAEYTEDTDTIGAIKLIHLNYIQSILRKGDTIRTMIPEAKIQKTTVVEYLMRGPLALITPSMINVLDPEKAITEEYVTRDVFDAAVKVLHLVEILRDFRASQEYTYHHLNRTDEQ